MSNENGAWFLFSHTKVGFAFLSSRLLESRELLVRECQKITHFIFCIDAREEGRNIEFFK